MIKDKVNTHFSKEFNGFVWKVMIDEKQDILALEIRNAAAKTTSFTCININNQQVTIDNLQLEDPWFCGMEIISDGILLLHYYMSESSPAHKGMIAFDAFTGIKLWENYTHAYANEELNSFKAYNTRIEPKRYIYLDKRTGEEIQVSLKTAIEEEKKPALIFPGQVSPESVKDYLSPYTAEGFVESANHDNNFILSFYIKENQLLTNILRVFNTDSELIWEDKILFDIQNQGFDTFFVYKKCLLYIKNRSKIVGIFL